MRPSWTEETRTRSSLLSAVPQYRGWLPQADLAARKYSLSASYMMKAQLPCGARKKQAKRSHWVFVQGPSMSVSGRARGARGAGVGQEGNAKEQAPREGRWWIEAAVVTSKELMAVIGWSEPSPSLSMNS